METKLKFKVGDKVRVKSLEWYNENKNTNGFILNSLNKEINFVAEMARFCGKILQIQEIEDNYYLMNEVNGGCYCWQDWMLEDEVVEDIKRRILTKEVAQAVVRCTKYTLKSENENANLQKKLFEIGCKWASGGKEVANEDCRYLYVDENLYITMGDVGEEDFYKKEPSAELSVNDILNIEIKDITMETKEMTKEEVFEYLNDIKILCTSKEESKKVQEKLFELGFSYYGEKSKEVVDCAFTLYINIHKKMQFGSDISMWVEDGARRVEPSEILAIQIKEEKPKFDPTTLQDFDKVLVRNDDGEFWCLDFYDSYRYDDEAEREMFYSISGLYMQCVPYNDETKHLKGTTEEAPEFYKIWK